MLSCLEKDIDSALKLMTLQELKVLLKNNNNNKNPTKMQQTLWLPKKLQELLRMLQSKNSEYAIACWAEKQMFAKNCIMSILFLNDQNPLTFLTSYRSYMSQLKLLSVLSWFNFNGLSLRDGPFYVRLSVRESRAAMVIGRLPGRNPTTYSGDLLSIATISEIPGYFLLYTIESRLFLPAVPVPGWWQGRPGRLGTAGKVYPKLFKSVRLC